MNSQKKWALLIGINRYPNLAPYYQLSGCVNDVELMTGILQRNFGFPAENISLLADERATRSGILVAMDGLIGRVKENDIVVVYYSGHGSQITDREGDEPDGKDETIVPYDSGRDPYKNQDITDDEIYLWLLRLSKRTSYVTLIFDCCHSGTISRDPFGVNSRWVESDDRPITELPPSPIPETIVPELEDRRRQVGPSGWLPLGDRYILIAGCRDEESSYEYRVEGTTHGILTYFLCQELTKVQTGATYRDVFEQVSTRVTAEYSRQHPQMEGARDRVLFGVREITPMHFMPLKQRKEDQVTIGGGAAHGMTVGSQWAVYPEGTKQISDETSRLGLVEIIRVRAVTSDAIILNEISDNAIAENARAVEEKHFYGEMRLVLDIQAPTNYTLAMDQLKEEIKQSGLLRLAKKGEAAEARVYILEPRRRLSEGDAVPQLKTMSEATWVVVGQDGKLIMPTHGVSETGAVFELRNNLEKAVRYHQTLKLRNLNDDSVLKNKVQFNLLRQMANGTWIEAEPETQSGQIVYENGDRIAARIVNQHNAPIFVSILDLGLSGAISQIYPVTGAGEQLAPGNTIEIGVRQGEEIELYIPQNFPYMPDPEDDTPFGGTETYKLFATTHEADFSLLVQSDYRELSPRKTKGVDTPLGQLLCMALTGRGSRDTRRIRLSHDEDWTSVERSFTLRLRKHKPLSAME